MSIQKITILAAAILCLGGLAACASEDEHYDHHRHYGDDRRHDDDRGDQPHFYGAGPSQQPH
jgi:hypothetical protein